MWWNRALGDRNHYDLSILDDKGVFIQPLYGKHSREDMEITPPRVKKKRDMRMVDLIDMKGN